MRALGMPRGTSLCAAPAMGVAFYTLLGEVNHLLGVASGPLTLLVGPSVALGAVAVWRSLRERGTEPSGISVAAALRYAAIGLAAFWIIFYRRIPLSAWRRSGSSSTGASPLTRSSWSTTTTSFTSTT